VNAISLALTGDEVTLISRNYNHTQRLKQKLTMMMAQSDIFFGRITEDEDHLCLGMGSIKILHIGDAQNIGDNYSRGPVLRDRD
jgi:hypothetical protein